MLEVTIKTLDGRNSLFSVEDETKVEDFKVEVEAKLGIPVAQQRLIFQGRVLQDNATLVDCGVDKKVIHLVPRPPPSAQADAQPGSTPTSGGPTTGSGGGVTWGGIDMQQAIQDITAGIFSGLGEFGRNVHFPPHTSGEPPGGPRSPASSILARERTFNRLHRQASHLLQRVTRHPLFPALERASDSSVVDDASPTDSATEGTNATAPASPLVEHSGTSFTEPSRKTRTTDRESSSRPGSPMTIDSDPECHTEAAGNSTNGDSNEETPNRLSHSETTTSSATTAERPISVLADMISRHRRLWRSAEPYLDRWEAMLNAESRAQEELVNSEPSGQEVKPMGPAHSAEGVAQVEPGTKLSERTDSPPPLTTQVVPAESGEPNTSDWHHRFFLQISRLLHLHAHMLHLISDFNVISIANASQESRDGQSESIANPVSEGQPVDTTAHNAGVATQSVPTTATDTANPTVEQREPLRLDNRRRRRVLRVPETEAHLVRARINIEPVLEPVALRPPTEGRPVPDVRGRPTLAPVFDRRRSQSASDTLRRSSDGTLIQVTVPGSTPRATEIPAISTSVHTAPLSTGGAAIIHRVDIPIISMNMLNLPIPAMFEQVITATPSTTSSQSSEPVVTTTTSTSDSTFTTTTTTTSRTATTATAAPQPSESVGSEASREPDTIPLPSTPVAPPHPTGLPHGPTDPFLLCHSRHFAHDPHFRRSTMGGSFGIPLPFPPSVQLIPTGVTAVPSMRVTGVTRTSSQPTTTQSSERSSTISQANTEMRPPTTTANEPQVRTVRPEGGSTFSIPSALSQQIAGFISAATNAATSAVTMGGGSDIAPFNVFLSSSPMQFTVTANRSTPRTTSDTTTSGSTPQVTMTTAAGGGGVPPGGQPFPWLFGGENPLMPTMSVASSLLQSFQRGAPQQAPSSDVSQIRTPAPPPVLTVPNWANTSGPESSPSRLDGVNLLLNEVIQGFVDTVWDRLGVLASQHDANFMDCASEPPTLISALPPCDQRIPVGLLTDVISAFQAEIPPVDETPFSASSLDGLRARLRHLLGHAESAISSSTGNGTTLVDMLTELVFDRRISDLFGSRTRVEATGFRWVTQTGGTVDQVVDIRASLARLFRTNLAAQLELWRTSPTNFGFGSTLLLTLSDAFVEFLCLLDVLVDELAQYTNIPNRLQAAGEQDFNGWNRVRDLLNSSTSATRRWATQMQRAFDECFARYRAMDSETLQRKWDYLKNACLVFRLVPIIRYNVPLDDGASQDDPPFVDACSELPPPENNLDHSNGSLGVQPYQLTTPVASLPQSANHVKPGTRSPSSCSSSGKVSPLPDWTPKPNELPDPWTRGLDPHPDSARAMMDAANVLNSEGWHAVLPAEWVGVVAGDVSAMTRNDQSTNGDVKSPQNFSDAYISGMPAKRRKVMQENARSVAKPPSAFLTDCLSDAIRVSGCEPNPTDNSPDATTVTTPPVVQTGAAATTPGRDLNLAVSLKEFVSEEIAKRLSTDPDFDPVQFPLSNELFVKKPHPNP